MFVKNVCHDPVCFLSCLILVVTYVSSVCILQSSLHRRLLAESIEARTICMVSMDPVLHLLVLASNGPSSSNFPTWKMENPFLQSLIWVKNQRLSSILSRFLLMILKLLQRHPNFSGSTCFFYAFKIIAASSWWKLLDMIWRYTSTVCCFRAFFNWGICFNIRKSGKLEILLKVAKRKSYLEFLRAEFAIE